MTQPGPWGTATTGYCAGLCIYWVSLCYAGKDLPYNAGTQEATGSASRSRRSRRATSGLRSSNSVATILSFEPAGRLQQNQPRAGADSDGKTVTW
jgi:hypothetical protein